MRTIEIPDEMYNDLIELAKEYTTQNNRMTAKPYLFQIREQKKVYDSGCNGAYEFWYDPDELEELESIEDFKSYYDDFPDDVDCISDLDLYHDEWLDEKNLIKSSYSWEPVYKNAFFTAKACKEHIESNHYHYNEPTDYLNFAWRNPEMDLISNLLIHLSK